MNNVSRQLTTYVYNTLVSPEYRNAPKELQQVIRDKMFDRHIKPFGLAHGLDFNRDTYFINWIGEGKQPEVAKEHSIGDYATAVAGKAVQTALKMHDAGITLGPVEAAAKYVDAHFNHGYAAGYINNYRKQLDQGLNTVFEGVPKGLETGWADHWQLKLAGMAGENIPQLPIMEGAGMLGKAASGALKAGPVATFFAKRAIAASEGYLFGLSQGHGFGGSGEDAGGFATIGLGMDLTGKFLGKMVGMMGRKGAQEVLTQAVEHLESQGRPGSNAHLQLSNPLIKANVEALNQIARKYGRTGYNFLSPEMKAKVLEEAGIMARKEAENIATHAPEVYAANVNADLAQTASTSKEASAFDAAAKQAGIDIAALATKEQQHEEQHGVPAVMRKIDNMLAEVEEKRAAVFAEREAAEKARVQAVTQKSSLPNLRLPVELRGSKPRYGYGDKNFQLQFSDERDLALYTIAQETKNKSHDAFMNYLKRVYPDKSESELVEMGKGVRGRIKQLAKDGNPEDGALYVKSSGSIKTVEQKPVPDWPENYKNVETAKAAGGGANYNADDVAALKEKHGIKDTPRQMVGANPTEVPGAATHKSLMFMENMKKKVESLIGDFHFENPIHGVMALAAYANRNKSEFPPNVRKIIFQHMVDYWKPRGANMDDIVRMVRHMPDLLVKLKMMQKDTTGAGAHKMGEQISVFASHFRGTGKSIRRAPTKWERMLDAEFARDYGVK